MRQQPVSFRRGPAEPRIEMCGQTTLFPADLPLLFGDQAAHLPRLCRVEISSGDEPSASVYFAPVPVGAESKKKETPPVLLACALLVRYLDARNELVFEDIPRDVDCCFKDTCGFPIVHVSVVGREAGGYDFKGVIHRRLNVVDEFAVSLSLDELGLRGA